MTKQNKLVIPLPLVTLNEYIKQERSSRFNGSSLKRKYTNICAMAIKQEMRRGVAFDWPTRLRFTWYWYNKRSDPDNIAFQRKFIFDGMMAAGFLESDGWSNMHEGFSDYFALDRHNPRVEIEEEPFSGTVKVNR